MICSVDGCERAVIARGWCERHYRRWRKWGDPERLSRSPVGAADELLGRIMEPSDGCRLWPYGTSHGYGTVKRGPRNTDVHVLVCEAWHGPRPEGMEAAHSCGNRLCWAGEHLRWATHAENSADMIEHGTAPRGERSVRAKLTEADVALIRSLTGTSSGRELARRFGVAPQTISAVVRRRNWAWLDEEAS